MKKLKIVSRNSKLALVQANFVKDMLLRFYPGLDVEIIGITTQGDKILDKSLDKIGGKGLFIKELEQALLANVADIAVHSMKDLPANLLSEFTVSTILKREDPRDAFVSNLYKSLSSMPLGSIVGTSSARRVALLNKFYPHLKPILLRGNLDTRLAKLDSGDYDAIILAVAGLNRLNLQDRITEYLPINQFIPAIGQGAVGIEILTSRTDLIELLKPLNDHDTRVCVSCERIVGQYLQASCSIPIASFASITDDQLSISGMVADIELNKYCEIHLTDTVKNYEQMAKHVADLLIKQGALDIINKYRA